MMSMILAGWGGGHWGYTVSVHGAAYIRSIGTQMYIHMTVSYIPI